jgi:hypothetical protein
MVPSHAALTLEEIERLLSGIRLRWRRYLGESLEDEAP